VILVLGGTSDGRLLAGELQAAGYDALLSVVGDYAARLAAGDGLAVRSGALDAAGLERLVGEAEVVVDATHPFAQEISASVVAAATARGRALLRFERCAGALPEGVLGADAAAAAAALGVARAGEGAIFLTVGSKTLAPYVSAARAAGLRLVARVLPTVESLRACAAAGLEPRDIVALQGPTSAGLDAALLRHLGATVLVTKQSGVVGGLDEKLQAAELAGATAIVVLRPTAAGAAPDAGADGVEPTRATTPAQVLDWLAATGVVPTRAAAETPAAADPGLTDARSASARRLPRGLLQLYVGDGKGKTTAAVGLALRARGAGLRVVFVQFVKGGRESSELAALRAAGVEVVRPAVARSGVLRGAPSGDDRAAAAAAWAAAARALGGDDCDLLVLDELHAALRHDLVSLPDVLAGLAARSPHLEVVATGRGAARELLDAADLITEMQAVRHVYPAVAARRGVEF
jgi:precorrin-6A/cobalt-precorrin-6A reductase